MMRILILGRLRNQISETFCATFSRSRGCSKQLRYISLCHLFTLRSGLKVSPRSLYLVLNLLSRGSLDDGQRLLPRFTTENGFQGFSREVNQGSRVFLEDFDVISEDASTVDYFGPQLKVLIQLDWKTIDELVQNRIWDHFFPLLLYCKCEPEFEVPFLPLPFERRFSLNP
jgi:hypothetical protein